MGRPHIEFIQALDVPPEAVGDGPWAGARRRMLSVDGETGAYTALLHVPAGFRTDLAGFDRQLELFGLAGSWDLGGEVLGPGGYVHLVPTDDARALGATGEATALVMVESETDRRDSAAVRVLDTPHLPWADRSVAAVPPGLTIKVLHSDPDTNDRTWLAALVPGWTEMRAELHPTVEEAFLLRGDGMLGARGEMTPGCYFWRPPMVEHGPMTTRGGQLIFFRTKGGGLEVSYVDVPGARELLDGYHAREPYFAPPLSSA